MSTTRKTRKKKLKAQTLTEFKAWLTGVEEMQDEGWVPNEQQWQLIRERIDQIKVEEAKKPNTSPQTRQVPASAGDVPVAESPALDAIPHVPSSFDRANVTQVEQGSSLQPRPTPQPHAPANPKEAVRTPDVDTSDGNYKSGFL